MATPIELASSQVNAIRDALKLLKFAPDGPNNLPTQPLNGRTVPVNNGN